MKHNIKITILILTLFLLAQFFGLAVIYKYIDQEKTLAAGKTEFKQLPIGERPPVEEKTSFIPIMIAILFGTVLLLVLIKFQLNFVWKGWFLIAVVLSLAVSLGAFMPTIIAFLLALLFGIWKIFRPNFWIQTITEVVIYGGLAAIFVPMLNIMSVSILLILIAIYDAYAVWKSKHMITLAKSQAQARIFAGLLVPYKDGHVLTHKVKQDITPKKHLKVRTAVLGGGDIGFPLIFAGVILKEIGLWQSLIIPFFSMLGLAFLLWYGNEHKFYPAMPFIGAGCFLGLAIVWLLQILF